MELLEKMESLMKEGLELIEKVKSEKENRNVHAKLRKVTTNIRKEGTAFRAWSVKRGDELKKK